MTQFEFIDYDPRRNRPRGPYERERILNEFAQALRDNPEQWAKYPGDLNTVNSVYVTSSYINTGRARAFQLEDGAVGRFQATAEPETLTVYVRFTKEAES